MKRNVIREVRVISALVETINDKASTESEKEVASKKIPVVCHKVLAKQGINNLLERNHLAVSLVELFKTKSTYFPIGSMWGAIMKSFLETIDKMGVSYRKIKEGNKLYIELL